MAPSPSAAPSPPPPHSPAGPLRFAPFTMFGVSLVCADVILVIVVLSYVCLIWRREWANPARSDQDIERPRRRVEAAELPVAVVAYPGGDSRELRSEECAICLASFEQGEECWVIVACGHGYHGSCIKEWLSRRRRCPLCRGSVRAVRAASVAPTSS